MQRVILTMTVKNQYYSTAGRSPLSVLAVRPITLSPPPIYTAKSVITPKPSLQSILPIPGSPTSPSKVPLPTLIPNISNERRPISPRVPIEISEEGYITTQNYRTSLMSNPSEGQLLTYIPNPFQKVLVSTSTDVKIPTYEVILPTILPHSIKNVVAQVEPQSPSQSPRTLTIASPPPQKLQPSSIISKPAIMTGSNPPMGEKHPVLVSIPEPGSFPYDNITYSGPIDISSYSISQEEAPLVIRNIQSSNISKPPNMSLPQVNKSTQSYLPNNLTSLPKYSNATNNSNTPNYLNNLSSLNNNSNNLNNLSSLNNSNYLSSLSSLSSLSNLSSLNSSSNNSSISSLTPNTSSLTSNISSLGSSISNSVPKPSISLPLPSIKYPQNKLGTQFQLVPKVP